MFFAIIVTTSPLVKDAFLGGITMYVSSVLPVLFPYAVITTIVSGLSVVDKIGRFFSPFTKKLFGVNGRVFLPLFIGITAGHPSGVKCVADLKTANMLTETESIRASAFCSMSSPVFLISCIGSIMFHSAKFGFYLFLSNILTALIIGIIFSFYKRKTASKNTKIENVFPVPFSVAVEKAVLSVLYAGGFIVVFYMLTDILLNIGALNPLIHLLNFIFKDTTVSTGIIAGLFESTKGFKIIAADKMSFMTLPLCAFITGFSGISMICQSTAFLKSAKIKTAPFIFSKILSAAICTLFGLIFSALFFG